MSGVWRGMLMVCLCFFFNDTATTEIYTLSLHDALPIFGAVSLSGAPLCHPERFAAMAAALAHRGPDGERIVGHASARLGARRLAIMDLTTGDQPFQSPDGAVWMVCNGEIYNAA